MFCVKHCKTSHVIVIGPCHSKVLQWNNSRVLTGIVHTRYFLWNVAGHQDELLTRQALSRRQRFPRRLSGRALNLRTYCRTHTVLRINSQLVCRDINLPVSSS